ncbi:hypothetical protein MHBO_002465 [Bonamia ostreae]|uniref:Uncharacterized protein n=1 Tax=Bonamia ostreae TaxID=126728 RepID=A0ABV2AME0_9EUKA
MSDNTVTELNAKMKNLSIKRIKRKSEDDELKLLYKKIMPEIGTYNKNYVGYDPDDMSKLAYLDQDNFEVDNILEITALLKNTHLDDKDHLSYFC